MIVIPLCPLSTDWIRVVGFNMNFIPVWEATNLLMFFLLFLPPDSIWPVYILPEEVGMRCHIIGINFIALKSGVQGGSIDIYNGADPSTPLISWERDKIRRTGKTGNLVLIEIGRRCQGGPGLVWMYAGFSDAQALMETIHK